MDKPQTPAPSHASTATSEVAVRQYIIAEFRNLIRATRTEGHINVTNKRIILSAEGYGAARHGAVHREIALNEIAGIGATGGFRFSPPHFMLGLITILVAAAIMGAATFMGGWIITTFFVTRPPVMEFIQQSASQVMTYRITEVSQLSLVFGLFVGFGGVTLYFIVRGKYWFRTIMLGASFGGFAVVALTGSTFSYVLMVASVLITMYGVFIFARLSDLVVTVYCKGGGSIDFVRGKGCFAGITGNTGIGYAEAVPVLETNATIHELGTVISDIQSQGDAGVRKWGM